jgi:predicted amidophosphoribosyltransferase
MVVRLMTKSENLSTGLTEFTCSVCHKVMKQKRHMVNHVETHIEGMSHLCSLCGKSFKTRNSREKHRYTYHKETTGSDAIPLFETY